MKNEIVETVEEIVEDTIEDTEEIDEAIEITDERIGEICKLAERSLKSYSNNPKNLDKDKKLNRVSLAQLDSIAITFLHLSSNI